MEVFGISVPIYVMLGIVAILLLYIYSTWNHDFFRKRGIHGPRPYPFIGNSFGRGLMQYLHESSKTYGKVFGMFLVREPCFVISDLEILKEIFVKSFNNFRNRRKFRLIPYPFNLSVFFLEDAAWKRVRNIITPTFSGGKLRAMCPAINDCSRTLTKNFRQALTKGKPVDMKEYFGAYTMDVISRTAFGVKVDSQNDFNEPFTSNAKKIFTPSSARRPFLMLVSVFPFLVPLVRRIGLSFFSNDVMAFFVKNVTDMIKERQQESKDEREKRTDFLQLLIDAEVQEDSVSDDHVVNGNASNGHIPDTVSVRRLTTDEIVGQGIIFFIAGYETTATTLNFLSYALATHPDIQEKLYQEIKDVLGDEEPDYDNVHKLRYMENVINETLRLYPPVLFLQRRAAETITIKGLTIPKESSVLIPHFSIQRDPELFTDPEEFRPERFDEKTNPLAFLSFGYGPRICIGMRLALVEAKIAVVHVMRSVKFERGPDTPENMTFKSIGVLQPKTPNMLILTPRS